MGKLDNSTRWASLIYTTSAITVMLLGLVIVGASRVTHVEDELNSRAVILERHDTALRDIVNSITSIDRRLSHIEGALGVSKDDTSKH